MDVEYLRNYILWKINFEILDWVNVQKLKYFAIIGTNYLVPYNKKLYY